MIITITKKVNGETKRKFIEGEHKLNGSLIEVVKILEGNKVKILTKENVARGGLTGNRGILPKELYDKIYQPVR